MFSPSHINFVKKKMLKIDKKWDVFCKFRDLYISEIDHYFALF